LSGLINIQFAIKDGFILLRQTRCPVPNSFIAKGMEKPYVNYAYHVGTSKPLYFLNPQKGFAIKQTGFPS
jgi:hypothetical protein